MGGDGIRCAFDGVKCERDALTLSFLPHACVELARALERAELARAVLRARHSFRGHRRIELERKPADLDAHFARERRERFPEATLADVAPRADHVRYHFDGQRNTHRAKCSQNPGVTPRWP